MNPQLRDILQPTPTASLATSIPWRRWLTATLSRICTRCGFRWTNGFRVRLAVRLLEGRAIGGLPFDFEFERVLRPLRYVVYGLHAVGTPYMSTREIVFTIGCHLEGCVKDLCGVTNYNQPVSLRTAWGHLPLGALVSRKNPWYSWLSRRLGGRDGCRAIASFCQLVWNPAKHDYHKYDPHNHRSPDPMIPFADAVAGYFLARALGAKVLRASGRLERVRTGNPART